MTGTSETPSQGNNAGRPGEVPVARMNNPLDFATYCDRGKIDAETDGDTWHADPERIPLDRIRDNDLETAGWGVLRFNTHHIREELDEYCVPTIVDNIDRLGGLNTGGLVSRTVWLDVQEGTRQLILFETGTDYNLD